MMILHHIHRRAAHYVPHALLVLYIVVAAALAIAPTDRATWWAENIPVATAVLILVAFYARGWRFSVPAYVLAALFLLYHTVGGHYTFAQVPFAWGNALLAQLPDPIGSFFFPDGRNNFDRLGHFLVGVFAFPVAEFALRRALTPSRVFAAVVGVFALGFWAALYEIIEAVYAISYGGAQAANFLGAQGDIWDAQKDMLLDILGAALFAGLFLLLTHRRRPSRW